MKLSFLYCVLALIFISIRADYTYYRGQDVTGYDLAYYPGKSIAELKKLCDGVQNCFGFNNFGYLKTKITPQNEWNPTRPDLDLYVKTGYRELPGYIFYQGRDFAGGDLQYLASRDLDQMKAICDANPTCIGLNTFGYLKNDGYPPLLWGTYAGSSSDFGLYIKIKQPVDHMPAYKFYNGEDSVSNDLQYFPTRNTAEARALCDGRPDCWGFNSVGYAKKVIKPQNEWQSFANPPPNYGLYVKTGWHLEIPGYTFHQGRDSVGGDLQFVASKDLAAIKELCDKNGANCAGFNTWGYLKKTLGQESAWQVTNPSPGDYGLYVKNPPNPCGGDGYTFYQGKDIPAGDILRVPGKSPVELKALCDANEDCLSFSTWGILKVALQAQSNWTTRADAKSTDGTCVRNKGRLELTGYTFYPFKGTSDNDIVYLKNKSLQEIKQACDLDNECLAFSSLGYLKNKIRPESQWITENTKYGPDYGLYIKKKGYKEFPGFMFIQARDSTGGDLAYYPGKSIDEMWELCLNDDSCVGFNTVYYLKSKIYPEPTWVVATDYALDYGLYVRGKPPVKRSLISMQHASKKNKLLRK